MIYINLPMMASTALNYIITFVPETLSQAYPQHFLNLTRFPGTVRR